MTRFTIYYTKSVIHIISLDVIKETTAIITKFNSF
jgi:hypothetical protein